jgi:hypothetical protein
MHTNLCEVEAVGQAWMSPSRTRLRLQCGVIHRLAQVWCREGRLSQRVARPILLVLFLLFLIDDFFSL